MGVDVIGKEEEGGGRRGEGREGRVRKCKGESSKTSFTYLVVGATRIVPQIT